MKILTVLMVLAPLTLAQDVLLMDDFSDGYADCWFEMATGATYEVNGDFRYEMSYTGSDTTYAISYRGDLGETMSEENYSVLVEIIGHAPTTNVGISVRFVDASGSSYTLYISYPYNNYFIYRYDSLTSGARLGSYAYISGGFDYLTPYWVRFECLTDTLRAKVWTGGSGDEPADWMIVRVDGTYQNNGCIALDDFNNITTNYCAEFDNVVVTAFLVSLESSTWGAIKSSF